MACQVAIGEMARLGAPDRHPDGGTCRHCRHCSQGCFDEAEGGALRDELTAGYGICHEDEDSPFLVALDGWHPWDECWTEVA